jgi:taste receptor type 2
VSITCCLLLIFSLWHHTRQMKLQGIYFRDSSTEAHVRAMKTVISFLVFVMYYICNFMLVVVYTILDSVMAKIFSHVLILLWPSGHPFLLILWNRKLKQASLCVLRKLKFVRIEVNSHSYKCT